MDLPGLWSIFTPSPSALDVFVLCPIPSGPASSGTPASVPKPTPACFHPQNGNHSLISWGKTHSSPLSYSNQIKSWPDNRFLFFFLYSRAFNPVSLMKFLSEVLIHTTGTYYQGKIALITCHVFNLMALHKLIVWFKMYLTMCSESWIEAFRFIAIC